jgi:hypothetical protein
MEKLLFIIFFFSLISFGQNSSNQTSWTYSEIERCKKDMLANLESDDESLQLLSFSGNSKESFAECACDDLEKLYDSYDLASSDLATMDEFQVKLITLPCLLKFDFTDDCVSGNCISGYGKQVLFNGEGEYVFQDGKIFNGQFKDGSFINGTISYVSGDVYTGEMKNGVHHGKGLFSWKNGATYYGEWKENLKSGHGTYKHKNGAVYTGEYENDLPHGQGEYTYGGSTLIGKWVNGKKHGKFIFRTPGVKDKKLKYRNGEKIK